MGQEFKINDCGEIIREKQPKKRNIIFRAIIGIIVLVCIIVAFPFIVGMIRYGEGIPGDNLGDYFDNRILVSYNGKRGYIDRLGREVIPIKYDNINYFSDYNEMIVCENDKWGLLDYDGNVIIPTIYDNSVNFINRNYCVAIKNGKAGVIDKHNNEIVSFSHDPETLKCYEELGIIVCDRQGRVGAFNFNKKIIIPFVYSKIGYFNNIGKAIAIKNSKYGIIDNKGNIVVDFLYDEMGDYDQCYIGDDRLISMRKKKHWGFIDDSGNEIISPQYEEVRGFFGDWAPVKKNGKWGFIDERGNIIVELIYDDLYSYGENSATVYKDGKKIEVGRP